VGNDHRVCLNLVNFTFDVIRDPSMLRFSRFIRAGKASAPSTSHVARRSIHDASRLPSLISTTSPDFVEKAEAMDALVSLIGLCDNFFNALSRFRTTKNWLAPPDKVAEQKPKRECARKGKRRRARGIRTLISQAVNYLIYLQNRSVTRPPFTVFGVVFAGGT
jgi:hypothetical protein